MRTRLILLAASLILGAASLSAGHRHGRECGHFFDSRRGGWISVQAAGAFGYASFDRRTGRHYADQRFYDDRHFKKRRKRLKKLRKKRLRAERRYAKAASHRHGPQCWR